ncbi:hypothetical protein F2Q69_00006909 [Brassica cretica]|uniref:Reverse transcriptase zinc-binding domain-containing protein n=1 Tax=Brassica cretica TaxID=69181 RepID=A0A8S9PE73_BRACR|nr:hypothetical protein F2Q69_00006909 [Brassica cretica]
MLHLLGSRADTGDKSNGRWLLRPARSKDQVALHAFLSTICFTDAEEYYEWELKGKTRNKYSQLLRYIMNNANRLSQSFWSRIVWPSGGIPKHSFLCWLFTLDRSPTKDRLLQWGLQTDPTCLVSSVTHINKNLFWIPLQQDVNSHPLHLGAKHYST